MALLALDSFDHYATATLAGKGWSSNAVPSSTVTVSEGTGRNGTQALRFTVVSSNVCGAAKALTAQAPAGATAVVGCAFRWSGTMFSWPILTIFDGAFIQMMLWVTSTGALEVRRPTATTNSLVNVDTTTIATTGPLLVSNTYAFVELKLVIANAGGTAEIKVNGVSVATFSGDTQGTATAQWSGLLFGSNVNIGSGGTWEMDDLYVCDGTGATHNDFLGDSRVVAVVASAGNGSNTAWTPSTGTDHGALVDENPPNTTDYVSTSSAGAIDTFNFAAVGVAGTVKAVQVSQYCKCDVAGLRTLAPAYRIGGANYAGAGVLLGSEWVYQSAIAPVSPATGAAWTVAEIDAAEFGAKVVT